MLEVKKEFYKKIKMINSISKQQLILNFAKKFYKFKKTN